VAGDAVVFEPVSTANSLLTGKLSGNSPNFDTCGVACRPIITRIQRLTVKFPAQQNREYLAADQGIIGLEQAKQALKRRSPEGSEFLHWDW
jgi:hypothetical protein